MTKKDVSEACDVCHAVGSELESLHREGIDLRICVDWRTCLERVRRVITVLAA